MAVDPFWSNFFRRRSKEEDELFAILRDIPIFQDLSRTECYKIDGILHRRRFAADEAIVREGEMGVGMFIIISGQIEIVQSGEDGQVLHLATLGPGDFFGEQALLDESPRTASAMAVEPCQAVGFFRPDLLELIESNPRLGLKIVMRLSQMISVRLRHTNRLLKEARDWVKKTELEKAQAEAESAPGPEVPAETSS